MAELKREVNGAIPVSLPAAPQENAIISGVKGILAIDAENQTNRLLREQEFEQERFQAEGLEARLQGQEAQAGQPSAAKVFNDNVASDGNPAPTLDPKDQQTVAEVRKSLGTNYQGLLQGATTYQESLINQERILKQAINRRPWLKQELIQASKNFIGVDVYQAGYKALAASEAARMEANDKAKAAEMKAQEDVGKSLRERGFVSVYSSFFSGSSVDMSLKSDAELAQFVRENAKDPNVIKVMERITLDESWKRQKTTEENVQGVEEIHGNKQMKVKLVDNFQEFNDVMRSILARPDLYTPGTSDLSTEGGQKVAEALAFQKTKMRTAFLSNLPQGVDYKKAEEHFGVLEKSFDDAIEAATGALGAKVTKDQLENIMARNKLLMLTAPGLVNQAYGLLKINPALANAPDTLNAMAADMGGYTLPGQPQAIISKQLMENSGQLGTAFQATALEWRKPQDPNKKAIALASVRSSAIGMSSNLSLVNKDTLIKEPALRGTLYSSITDIVNGLVGTSGEKDGSGSILDALGQEDKVVVGRNIMKTVLTLQDSLIKEPQSDSTLARFYAKGNKGNFLYYSDGTIKAELPEGTTPTPAEAQYMERVRQHNNALKSFNGGNDSAATFYNKSMGFSANQRIPMETMNALRGMVVVPPKMATYAPTNWSHYAPVAFPEKGVGKSQGAKAPKEAPIGIRNNNPGNLRTGEGGKFGVYPTMREGIKAAENNLIAYQRKYGINTIKAAIERWAPKEDNNDTNSYINHVSRATGIPKDQPVDFEDKETRKAILLAMFEIENGPKWKDYWM